ncbi:MAG: carbohydrate porin [Richelia sp. SL_2_1]|nr:carbohydrate porin [Richelia sp. SM1_7_0]NJN10122.1 carbohydrate porin [Richelia sp. RM1_1_1]NJO27130.1 carbohydrate porin [Richelia sp. SL_2_1]
MSYLFRKVFTFSSQAFVASLVLSSEVQAQEIQNIQEDMSEVPSVSELSEVESEEWNFQVLQNFIQRYNIDTKYPLANLQRQDVITRYEFALILNEVIQYINNSQTTNTNIKKTNSISQQELEYLSKLQNEFAFELHGINQRVEILETQSFPQFSTTSKLSGEVIFALTGVGEGNKADDDEKTDSNITFSSRTKLQLNTTFTGKDRLKTSLKTSNIQPLDSATGTNMARLSAEGDDENQFELGDFAYRFPVGKRTRVHIGSTGLEIDDFANTINPYLDANDDGAVSRFAQRNPIYRQGGGAGIGIEYEISDSLELGLGYVADDADEPEIGLNKSDYAAIAQLTFKPNKTFLLGLNYIHSYNNINTNTGSDGANDPFDDNSESINANSFGLQGSVALNKKVSLGSWVGYTHAQANDLPNKPTASIFNWAFTLAFPDLGKKGNLGGIIIGQPPKLISNQYQLNQEEYTDKDTSLHLEAFYRFQINDNITITPGMMIITNPEHNSDNDTIYLGTLRTTFSF